MRGLRQHQFSLIELLVTVGVISILASMLMPALVRAKETSKRTICASQLKNLATTMELFADDNDGRYPTCWTNMSWALGPYILHASPSHLSSAGPPDAPYSYPANAGTYNGTAGFVYEQYGMAPRMFWCPSRPFRSRFSEYQKPFARWGTGDDPLGGSGSGRYDGWGCKVEIGYMIVAGFSKIQTDGTVQLSVRTGVLPNNRGWIGTPSWETTGVAMPAEKQDCDRPAEELLAADSIIWYDWWGLTSAAINHVSAYPFVSAYQNMLFADHHVEGRSNAQYNVQNATATSPYVGYQTYDFSNCYFWGKAY